MAKEGQATATSIHSDFYVWPFQSRGFVSLPAFASDINGKKLFVQQEKSIYGFEGQAADGDDDDDHALLIGNWKIKISP